MIRPETIQSILETARIEEVIGDFVSLKKRGTNYLGLCPFHNEKTPSFSVSPSKGIYKCFGCGKAGNVVNFVMEHEHYSYPEGLKYLAKRYGIEVEEEEVTPEMKQEMDERESMFAVNSFITKHLHDNLFNSNEGKSIGLTYLKERDFREAAIENFQLGYALDQWEAYSAHALDNGYKKEILVKTGLSIDKNDRLIDRFKGRVIFPIHNLTGKVIGFGGRILSSEKSTAKYINSPESDIYNKSKALYGIYFARNAIVKHNNCYLVEGYTDVISLHQAGFENVVSSSGTALTVDQIKLIKRFTTNITILYDGDPAGIKASFRGIDLILEQGMNVKIVLFPEGEDPDSYVRGHRTSEVDDFINKQADDFIRFKTKLLIDETVDDPAGRAALIKEIVNTIAHIPDGISRSVYIKECSTVMDIPEQTLMNELNKSLRKKYSRKFSIEYEDFPVIEEKSQSQSIDDYKKLDPHDSNYIEREIISLLLNYGNNTIKSIDDSNKQESLIEFIIEDITKDEITFENEIYRYIFNEFKNAYQNGKLLKLSDFIAKMENEDILDEIINLTTSEYELDIIWEKNKIDVETIEKNLDNSAIRILLRIKFKVLLNSLNLIEKRLNDNIDDAERTLLQIQHIEAKKILAEIAKMLGQVIIY